MTLSKLDVRAIDPQPLQQADIEPIIKGEKSVRSYEAYAPAITRVAVDIGSGLYRHVPSITIKSTSHVLGAYLLNNASDTESTTGQTAVFVRSTLDGASWSAPVAELNGAGTCNNPLTPVADSRIQGEIFVLYDAATDQEVATVVHRGGANGSNKAFVSFRSAQAAAKWTNYAIRFATADNAVNLSSADVTGTSAGTGYKLTYTIGGAEYDIIPFKPVIAQDGALVVPVVLTISFGTNMRIGFMIRRNGVWSMGGVIPNGVAGAGDAWEPTTWQAEDGTWYCQVRRTGVVGNPSYDNHAIAQSSDLLSWAPFANLNEDIHGNRHIRMRARDDLWLGTGTSHDSNRNNLALFVSPDGHQWVHGATLGAETDSTDFSHYSDIATLNGIAYVLYSEEDNQASSAAPNEIRFARFALPADLPLMGTAKNVYEADAGTAPSVSGTELTLPPKQMGSIPTPEAPCVIDLRVKVSAAPGATPYKLISVGDEYRGYFSVEYRNNAGTTELYAGGVFVEVVPAPTEYRSIQVAVDVRGGIVSACGQTGSIGRFGRVYLGDTTVPGTGQAGNIVYDAANSAVSTYRQGLPRQSRPVLLPMPYVQDRAGTLKTKFAASVVQISVRQGNLLLDFVRDDAGTALVLDDGTKWSPLGIVYPDHFAENVTPGTTNMTTACQAAIDWSASSGASGRFSGAVYGVTGIQWKQGADFEGSGNWSGVSSLYETVGTTVLKYIGAGGANSYVINFSSLAVGTEGSATDQIQNLSCRNITVDGNQLAHYGCYFNRSWSNNELDYITVTGTTLHAFWVGNCWNGTIRNWMAFKNQGRGITLGINTFGWSQCFVDQSTIISFFGYYSGVDSSTTYLNGFSDASPNLEYGIGLGSHRGLTIINPQALQCGGAGIYRSAGSSGSHALTIIGGYVENNGQSSGATAKWDLWYVSSSALNDVIRGMHFGVAATSGIRITGSPNLTRLEASLILEGIGILGTISSDHKYWRMINCDRDPIAITGTLPMYFGKRLNDAMNLEPIARINFWINGTTPTTLFAEGVPITITYVSSGVYTLTLSEAQANSQWVAVCTTTTINRVAVPTNYSTTACTINYTVGTTAAVADPTASNLPIKVVVYGSRT